MIQPFDHVLHDFAQVLEIKQQLEVIEIFASERDANLVIVAVRILALAFVVAQERGWSDLLW